MADAASAGATPLHPGLPDEIVIWEILVRLPPKSLLRCRAVCRAWRRLTSTRDFLLAHHRRQPSLPIVRRFSRACEAILSFDHRAAAADAKLQPVARLDEFLAPRASCDGLLILSGFVMDGTSFSVYNPATRQHAPLWQQNGFRLLGMYRHRPTGEYRLLLHRSSDPPDPFNGHHPDSFIGLPGLFIGHGPPKGKIGYCVFELGSDQPRLRYIAAKTAAAVHFETPAVVHDCLHWYPVKHQNGVLVFDTVAESFRQMRPPVVPDPNTWPRIFEAEGTVAISGYDDAMKTVDIWVLQNYEGEVWEHKYRVELPVIEIRARFVSSRDDWIVSVVSADGDVLLLLKYDSWLLYVDTGGKLVDSFNDDCLYSSALRLKQTLVPHTFFTALEGRVLDDSPFI